MRRLKSNNIPKKPKLLFVSHTSNPGGAEIVLTRFLPGVTHFEMMVLAPEGYLLKSLREKGISTIPSNFLKKLNKQVGIGWVFRFPIQIVGTLLEILQIAKKEKPHIIQANSFYAMVYCILPAMLSRIPLVWHMHDFVGNNIKYQLLSRLYNRFACRVIAVSESVRQNLLDLSISPNKIATVYNSMPSGFESNSTKSNYEAVEVLRAKHDRVFGLLGSIEERKGTLESIEALGIAKSFSRKRIGLLIAGDASNKSQIVYKKKVVQRIAELNLNENVLLLGRIEDIKGFFRSIDTFIHYPKFPDPLPTSILEALYYHCPVIVSDNGGNPECVNFGKWGQIIPSNKPELLAKSFLSDQAQLNKDEYEAFLNHFSHKKKEAAHLSIYRQIIDSIELSS